LHQISAKVAPKHFLAQVAAFDAWVSRGQRRLRLAVEPKANRSSQIGLSFPKNAYGSILPTFFAEVVNLEHPVIPAA
jgi:hypothetical protein